MKHEDLIDLGFSLKDLEECDPYYIIIFTGAIKFGVCTLAGNLQNDIFTLYGNNTEYTDKNKLIKTIEVVGAEIYQRKKL